MNTKPSRIPEVIDRSSQAFPTMKTAALLPAIVLSTLVPAQAQQPTTRSQPSHTEVDAMNNKQPSRTSEVIDRFNQAFKQHDGSSA